LKKWNFNKELKLRTSRPVATMRSELQFLLIPAGKVERS